MTSRAVAEREEERTKGIDTEPRRMTAFVPGLYSSVNGCRLGLDAEVALLVVPTVRRLGCRRFTESSIVAN